MFASIALAIAVAPISQMSSSMGLPVVDMAHLSRFQVVVDREPGQYLGHPTTHLMPDGKTLWCVYPKGHGRGSIILKRSDDAGKTWSERLPTPKNWETSQETPTLYRVKDNKTGKPKMLLFSGLYPIRMAQSENEGKTWSELAPIGDYGGIVAMGSLETLKSGELVAFFHDDGRFIHGNGKVAGKFTLYQVNSKDVGLTWSAPREIWSGSDVHLCEPGLVRSPNKKRIGLLLRENSRRKNSFVMFSDDECQSWSAPRELPASLTGDRHTAKYLPDGRLFISFRDMAANSPTKGDWVGWIGTWDDIEKGREGQYRIRLMDNLKGSDCAYPGVEVLRDGTIVTTTYGHWTEKEEPYIVCVRFKLSDLGLK
ncbi:MAG TPA: sialidase family protein [Fimbriimonas sp.]|nr:sialidase family protein [Fimbriimonas sp.]